MNISSISSNYYSFYQTSTTQTKANSNISGTSEMPPPPPPPSESMMAAGSNQSESSTSDPSDLMEQFSMMSSLMFNELTDSGSSALSGDHPRAKIDSLVGTDLETLTEEEVTDTLTDLQNTLSNAPYLPEVASSLVNTDISSLSTTEQSELLSSFQEEAATISATGMDKPQGPPPGPPPGGIGGVEETDTTDLLELLLERLEEDEEDQEISDTQADFLENLKTSITSYLEEVETVV